MGKLVVTELVSLDGVMVWRLAEVKPVGPDGVVVLVYERAR